ncbi:MAG: hypothetical protein RJB38_1269 [Pseudomonadota bacterium]|jgi:hypothetical protein
MKDQERLKRGRVEILGQSVAEYVLLLFLTMMLFQMVRQALSPVVLRLSRVWVQQLEGQFSKNLHRYP